MDDDGVHRTPSHLIPEDLDHIAIDMSAMTLPTGSAGASARKNPGEKPENVSGEAYKSHPMAPIMRPRKSILDSGFQNSLHRYDDLLLKRAVEDAGRWAYGTVLVELWTLSEDSSRLFRPENGWWVDPVYHRDCSPNCQICRLVNRTRDDYMEPTPLAPGEGLPGVLWSEVGANANSTFRVAPSPTHRRHRRVFSGNTDIFGEAKPRSRVVWREMKTIADDPDQPWNPRLQLLASLGLGWAAAVAFNLHGHQGIVIYMARDGVDMPRMQSVDNEAYLVSASDLVGAAYSLRGPRRKMVERRRTELKNTLYRVRCKILAIHRMGKTLDDVVAVESVKPTPEVIVEPQAPKALLVSRVERLAYDVKLKAASVFKKTRGSGCQPPPTFTWRQACLTFVGVFTTLLMLTRLNHFLVEAHGREFAIVLGPFGALMTLQYGLTAAPASQPSNALLGQAVAMSIALAISYTKDTLSLWMRQSLSTALAVTTMVKLGITHPPAGAAALILSSGGFGWGNFLMILVGNVIAVGSATLINNWSSKRQYPSYWGLGLLGTLAERLVPPPKKEV